MYLLGWMAAFVKSRINGALTFERTIKQATRTMLLAYRYKNPRPIYQKALWFFQNYVHTPKAMVSRGAQVNA